MVPLLGIVSRQSNMGKTTLVRELITRLTHLGYRVGAIKKVHEMQLDHPGKDSWVFQQAGACSVAILGQDQTALIRKTKTPELPDQQP
ncbi:MAG: molybdopterin-guanine dinucleotide biosynthesis protein MobB, partial [Spirochaetales bacterium]